MRFVTFLWRGRGFWTRTATYGPEHVKRLASMLARHGGHCLSCIHDGSFGSMPGNWDMIRMPEHVAGLPDYLPKLWAWSPELHDWIGERFVSIDLDVVVLGDVAPLLAGPERVRLWDSAKGEPYNTSLFVVQPGAGQEVWSTYTPERLAAVRAAAPRWTGDQSWVAHVLGPGQPTFGERDGVIRYRRDMRRVAPPRGTRAAFFCGPMSPDTEARCSEWVAREWT
jgi:hypothetical protein